MAPTQNKDKKDKTSVMSSNSAKIASDKVVKSKTPFRYAWQKKGRFVYQEALLEAENADSPEGKSKQRGGTPKQFDGRDDGYVEGSFLFCHPVQPPWLLRPEAIISRCFQEAKFDILQC
jgi:hypothetical protein